jgi:hypothetical protein
MLPPAARGRFLKKLPPWTPRKNFWKPGKAEAFLIGGFNDIIGTGENDA